MQYYFLDAKTKDEDNYVFSTLLKDIMHRCLIPYGATTKIT